jgi:hypothetical protein
MQMGYEIFMPACPKIIELNWGTSTERRKECSACRKMGGMQLATLALIVSCERECKVSHIMRCCARHELHCCMQKN